ncbi:MAG: CapA family protein [Clostridia bacterium]|nr:CapA family protein [Clostridia bacterium]
MEKTVRISFIGDIMCEKPLQRAYDRYGAAVFDRVFAQTKELFARSDLTVGNLETVFGGAERGYTDALYRFNTPDDFACAVSRGGIGLLTTATNHCLDCGIEGLKRTVDVLEAYGIAHTGTRRCPSEPRFLVRDVGGLRIAFLNYAYGTNVHETGVLLREDELYCLNLLKPQTYRLQTYADGRAGRFRRTVSSGLALAAGEETRIRLKRLLGMAPSAVRIDDLDESELDEAYLLAIDEDLSRARDEADVVIVCLHCGGQFNPEPGGLSEYFARYFAERGADAVVCHHAHVVQRTERIGNVPVAYCLGNYSISPSSVYLLREDLPEYAVVRHLTVGAAGVVGTSFSVIKILEDGDGVPVAWPADRLYDKLTVGGRAALLADVERVCRRFSGMSAGGSVLSEYKDG